MAPPFRREAEAGPKPLAIDPPSVLVNRRPLFLAAALLALSASLAAAQADTAADEPLSDNSFLVEEAYNQEPGVVQHINTFMRGRGGDWGYTLTQEWPLAGMRHQISYTIPIVHPGDETGVGDVMVHYRYQWLDGEGGPVAAAPRLSAVLSTGSSGKGLGAGGFGIEAALPVSVEVVKDRIVTHSNAGARYVPRAQDPAGNHAATTSVFLAQSAVWLVRPMFNVLLEAAWAREEFVAGPGGVDAQERAVISPGVRFGLNLPGDLQVVPGIAVPIGIGPSSGDRALFLYLSFEHPFTRRR